MGHGNTTLSSKTGNSPNMDRNTMLSPDLEVLQIRLPPDDMFNAAFLDWGDEDMMVVGMYRILSWTSLTPIRCVPTASSFF